MAYLHAAGREDIDVRMLGTGRPFIFEVMDPKKSISSLKAIDKLKVQTPFVSCKVFTIVDTSFFNSLKEIESSKAKRYCSIAYFKNGVTPADCASLNSLRNVSLQQQTPVRVLHRRSQMTRDKMIYRMYAVPVSSTIIILHLLASAGTYIKEFVHSDLGRTFPNVSSLVEEGRRNRG